MIQSIRRMCVIAHNTLLEAIRQKVLMILLLFALVCIGSANFFTDFAYEDQLKFIKDFSFGAMTIFGFMLGVLGAAQMMQAEIENRTIYTILSKPIRRAELIWGKFLGLCLLILLAVGLMTIVFLIVLDQKEASLIHARLAQVTNVQDPAVQFDIKALRDQAQDPQMVEAWLLVCSQLILTASLATLISTIATSMIFTVSTTLMLYIVGHLQPVAREVWFGSGQLPALWQKVFAGFLAILVPDFGAFGIMDDILAGSKVPWHYTFNLMTYTAVYVAIVMVISQVIFDQREF